MLPTSKYNEQKKLVLVVDDHYHTGLLLKTAIENMDQGYEVTLANDGFEALDIIRQTNFDLVLTDYSMPGMDGLELIDAIVALVPNTTIMVTTGVESASLKQLFVEKSVESVLYKPFTIENLELQIKETLEQPKKTELVIETSFSPQVPDLKTNDINSTLLELCRNTGAFSCFLVDANGFLILEVGGDEQTPIQMLASLTAANALATAEVSSLLGNRTPFRSTIHEGEVYNVACYMLDNDTQLVIVFRKQTKVGLVQHYARQAIKILADCDIKTQLHSDYVSVKEDFDSEVDIALDELFD
ncbi:MAG: response regulator [Chloroflexota bacterium]